GRPRRRGRSAGSQGADAAREIPREAGERPVVRGARQGAQGRHAARGRPEDHPRIQDGERGAAGGLLQGDALGAGGGRRALSARDLSFATVAELGALLRAKKISPVELTKDCLARAESLDPSLHAWVTMMGDSALQEARRAEKEIAAGKIRGPLHGIPYGAKDLVATAGVRTTWGAKPYEAQVFDRDAAVVRRLRAAGAILIGKLAMIELAGGLGYTKGDASLTGAARNPWDIA